MRMLVALVLPVLLIGPSAASAQSATYDIPAHVSRVEGAAVLERDAGDEALEPNLTLVEGDRLRTRSGRVEILFADGTLLHLDRNTVIDFQRGDFVRVLEGRARWLIAREARATVRVDTPAATLELDPGGDYRVAVAPNGDAELAVLRGAGALLNDLGDTSLRAGERAVAARGRAPSQAYYSNAAAWDDFDRWSDTQRRAHASIVSVRYLPNELHPYGSVFDSYGSWQPHPSHGYVWYPVANAGWQPYSDGRWHTYPRYGATWIGRDPWAWPTHHFGRWGFSAGAWFWIPGRSWGPAWVSWASSPGYIGWSPLGWDNRPILSININTYRHGSSSYPWCGWTFIRERQFGGRWRPADVFIGAGISVVARNGIRPETVVPPAGRARPRSGTAVPRGSAVPRNGDGLSGTQGSGGDGLASVPNARPRRVPTETIRSTGSTGSIGSIGSPGSTGSIGSPGSRERSAGSSSTGSTARPRGEAQPETTAPGATPPAVAGRPVRRPSSGGSVSESPSPYEAPARRAAPRANGSESGAAAPYSTPDMSAPRARSRELPAPPAATSPATSSPAPRARVREPRESNTTPRESGTPPRGSSAQPREPREQPRERARPAPAEGGGSERRAAPRQPSSGGGSQTPPPTRRRAGG